mmetsp:Transcript_56124/g.133677  ORF Transcript_56124/g.133677 Transcript_56124/m.133677 type:complete len:229 (-) Transcript_56124:1637-2323(-)
MFQLLQQRCAVLCQTSLQGLVLLESHTPLLNQLAFKLDPLAANLGVQLAKPLADFAQAHGLALARMCEDCSQVLALGGHLLQQRALDGIGPLQEEPLVASLGFLDELQLSGLGRHKATQVAELTSPWGCVWLRWCGSLHPQGLNLLQLALALLHARHDITPQVGQRFFVSRNAVLVCLEHVAPQLCMPSVHTFKLLLQGALADTCSGCENVTMLSKACLLRCELAVQR